MDIAANHVAVDDMYVLLHLCTGAQLARVW